MFYQHVRTPSAPVWRQILAPSPHTLAVSMSTQCKQHRSAHARTYVHRRKPVGWPHWKLCSHASIHMLLTRAHAHTLSCQSSGGKNSHLRRGSAANISSLLLCYSLHHAHTVFGHYHLTFSHISFSQGAILPPPKHTHTQSLSFLRSSPPQGVEAVRHLIAA